MHVIKRASQTKSSPLYLHISKLLNVNCYDCFTLNIHDFFFFYLVPLKSRMNHWVLNACFLSWWWCTVWDTLRSEAVIPNEISVWSMQPKGVPLSTGLSYWPLAELTKYPCRSFSPTETVKRQNVTARFRTANFACCACQQNFSHRSQTSA